jgi:RES domain-containing protein
MKVFRLAKEKYKSDLSGKGAEIAGGRWNSKGTALLYTSNSRALCMAEVLVHQLAGFPPENYWMLSIEVPDNLSIETIDVKNLPSNWRDFPHPPTLKAIGDAFVRAGTHPGLLVPSAVVAGDFNLLLNPHHPEFATVKIQDIVPFEFDERLLKY